MTICSSNFDANRNLCHANKPLITLIVVLDRCRNISNAELAELGNVHNKVHWLPRMSSSASSVSLGGNACDNNNGNGHKLIKEGSVEIKVPNGTKVFYNPVQEFNRDLSVAVLYVASQHFTKEEQNNASTRQIFRILEALSATGLRSIRYAKEIPYVTEILTNDISKSAIEIIESNIQHNNVENKVHSSNMDAVEVMFNSRHPSKRFQAVDLDPYGCPSQFLDTAVQCVEDGGFLLVTCTDMAVLCGNSPETCFVKYGAISLKTKACHEMALRIALHCIQSHAGKYKRYIVPVISISVDFYIRVIVKIFTSAAKCKEVTSKLATVYQCSGCDTIHLQPLGVLKRKNDSKNGHLIYNLSPAPVVDKTCVHCNGKHYMGGPIWSAPLHDLDFIREVINVVQNNNFKTRSRLLGILNMILEELYDVPLYYNLPKLCSILKSGTIPMMSFRSAVLNGGYRISYSHANKESFKTDAPMTFIWDVTREWIKENPVSQKNQLKGGVAYNILSKASVNKIDFSLRLDANPLSRKNKLLRFQVNPTAFWGPGTRSTSNTEKPEKSIRNQNKKKRKGVEPEDCDNKRIACDERIADEIS